MQFTHVQLPIMVIICGAVILCISIQILKQLLLLANLSESSKERVVDRHGALKNKEIMRARIGPSDELFFTNGSFPASFSFICSLFKHTIPFLINLCEEMSIQYLVLGFEFTTV